MNDTAALNLAEALATRLCHDLAGPVSAVGNGIELLNMEQDPMMQKQARELLEMSAQEGMVRLQLYRTAFGQLKDIRVADTEETRDMVHKYLKRSPLKLDWEEGGAGFAGQIPNALRQILCCMVLFMASQLAFGGTLSIRHIAQAPGGRLVMRGSHARMKEDAASLAVVRGQADKHAHYTPYNVIPHVMVEIAHKSGFLLVLAQKQQDGLQVMELVAEYSEELC